MIDTNLQNIKKEMLILVNDKDEDIGSASKKECHEGSGLLHRAFSVFIFNQRKEVLMKRCFGVNTGQMHVVAIPD